MPSHQEICYLWASGNKSHAKGYAIEFEGREIYSWGRHYLLGFKMSAATFLLNSTRYSVSTSKHQTYARRATHGRTFYVPDLTKYRDELRDIARHANRTAPNVPAASLQASAESAAVRMFRALAPIPGQREGLEMLADYAGIAPGRARKMIDAAIRAGERDADKAAKRQATIDRAAAMQWAKRPMADTESEIASQVATLRTGSEYQARDALHRLEYAAKEAGRNHRNASKAGLSKKTIAAIWRHVKAYRAAIADHNAKGAARARLSAFQKHNAALRANLKTVATMPDSTESLGYVFGVFRAIGTSAAMLRGVRHASHALNAKLSALIEWADKRQLWEDGEAARIANAKRADEIAAWRRGEPVRHIRFDADSGGAAIRAVDVQRDESGDIVGGTLETSHGASVPLPHAVKAFRFVKLCRERGTGWASNGRIIRVGHYQIDGIDADGNFKAGCHRFAWPEIAALATRLGVFDAAPDESAVTINPNH